MNDKPPRVVVTDHNFPSLETERKVLEPLRAVVEEYQCRAERDVIEAVSGADVVLVQYARIGKAAINNLDPGAVIIRYGIGVDNVDLDAAKSAKVAVANVPDYGIEEVVDHTLSLLLSLLRRIPMMDRSVRADRWHALPETGPVYTFSRTAVGVVGLGRIGQLMVSRLRALGFELLVHDPYVSEEYALPPGARRLNLETLLREADAVCLHVPLTEATHHLLNAKRLGMMKSTAVIVNTARGGLIDSEALIAALHGGELRGAALDVFEEEPLPAESRLRQLHNVLLTPHLAWYSEDAIKRLQRFAAEEAARAIKGEPLRCPVITP